MKLFVQTVYEIVGWKAMIPIILILFQAILESVGVMLLVPMLGLVGITDGGNITGIINTFITFIFNILGIPKSLIMILFIYILIISCREILIRTQKLLSSQIQFNIIQSLRDRLYISLCRAEWIFLTKIRSSDCSHILTVDITRLGVGANTLIQIISTIILLSIYVIFAMTLSFSLTVLTLSCGCMVLFVLKKKVLYSSRTGKRETDLGKKLHSIIMEHLISMKLAKIFCAEERSIDRFKRVTSMLMGNFVEFADNIATTKMWFGIISVVIISFFVYISIEVVGISTVSLMLLLFIFARMMPQLSALQGGLQKSLHVKPALISYLDMENACKGASEKNVKENVSPLVLRDCVSFRNVFFSYNKKEKNCVLRSISFTVPTRSTLAIVGSSGSGKSTIADLLMGLLYPDSGEILIDGEPLSPELLKSWRQAIAYVPQEDFLLNDTIRENLLWFNPDVCEKGIQEALQHAAAMQFIEKLPQGLDTVIGDRGVRLSGGERQRIALARALLKKPQLLILDEATSSLDVENERHIQRSIEGLHGNITIVVIAHRLSTIRNADKIIVIDDGKVVETGTWEELVSKENGKLFDLSRI